MSEFRKQGPTDPNVSAFNITRLATGEADCAANEAKKQVNHKARKGGLLGGKARAENLTKEERTAIAKKAAQVRWAKES